MPLFDNRASRLFPYAWERDKDHIPRLWRIAAAAANGGIEDIDATLFNECIRLKCVKIGLLSIALFWINPDRFLPYDSKTAAFTKINGVAIEARDYESYRKWMTEVSERLGTNNMQISHDAHLFATRSGNKTEKKLGSPFNDLFATIEEANTAFDLLGVALTRLGVSEEKADTDERIALTLPKGGTLKMRLNFGNWAILTFMTKRNDAQNVQFLCRNGQDLAQVSFYQEPFAERINGTEFNLAHVPFEVIQDLTSAARIEFESSLEQAAKRFEHWNSSPWRDLNNRELLSMVFDRRKRAILLQTGISAAEVDPMRPNGGDEIKRYDKKAAMEGLFLSENQFDEMLAALKEKKNVILQGAPGVGKTYVARRLAYALVGSNDARQAEVIQFHQSYSYEDFIQGFRPTVAGHFDLKDGLFYEFCRRAQSEEASGKPYVFIIDEINRGNLSKIFGELMMLIEADKRGKEHAIPLAYCRNGEKFYIPGNVYLIGMMNTADRSLAMVDYALRRRFRFITLKPAFSSEVFVQFLKERGASTELIRQIVTRMAALNAVVHADGKNLGPGYQIGHSYFCPAGTDVRLDDAWYRRVIESEIVPLLEEYWFDDEQKVKQQHEALLAPA
ncbi:MAG TPA: AAA family ATPase [Verrucomicrobiae bacterium]